VALGVEFGLAGCAFAAVAAVTAQLTSGARGARSIAILVLDVAWVLRLAGDISAIGTGALSWLSWLTPIGWGQHLFPYGENNFGPANLTILFTVAVTALGGQLLSRRDFGDGLFPDRPGPATAKPSLRTPLALAWRLHRGLLAAWTISFFALGLVFGGVAGSIEDLSTENSGLTSILGRLGGTAAITDAYFATTAGILGLIAAGYGIQATLRLREEETTGHAEELLTDRVSRLNWATSHLVFSLLGPALVLAAAGLAEGLTHGNPGGLIRTMLAELPAVWILAAVAIALFGLLPRASAGAWGALALCVLILLVGQTLELNQWLLDISPFTHVREAATPLITLTVTAAVIAAVGLVALRRRDIPA
jgi:ABC-2 type transport system permease protein